VKQALVGRQPSFVSQFFMFIAYRIRTLASKANKNEAKFSKLCQVRLSVHSTLGKFFPIRLRVPSTLKRTERLQRKKITVSKGD